MLTYEKRNNFIQSLHPLASVLLLLLYLIVFVVIKNPIYLFLSMISVLFLAYSNGVLKELYKYIKIIIPFAVLIIILNSLLVKNGDTVIYEGKINYPLFGVIRITLEAILFGVLNGIRITCITLIFGLANLNIHPDRAFAFFSKYIKNSALLMSMTIRLFPNMIRSFESIKEVEKLRGNKLFHKKMKNTIISHGNIVNILFLSSIEDASDTAEAMYSRGYGAHGKRSSYFKENLKSIDIVLIIFTLIGIILSFILTIKGIFNLEFYPKLENPIQCLSFHGMIFCCLLFMPFLISLRWNTWK